MGRSANKNKKFVTTVEKFAEVTEASMGLVKRYVAKEMFRRIIERTPIWMEGDPNHPPGLTKGNWSASQNRPTTAILNRVDSTGEATIAAMEKVVDKVFEGKSIFLSNSTPHIQILEDGGYPKSVEKGSWNPTTRTYEKRSTGGWSNQLLIGPAGMVKITLAEFEDIVNMAARKYKVNIF